MLFDMGGVLVPDPPGYEGAASDAGLVARFRDAGFEDPESAIRACARRLHDAYRALEAQCTQPDPDVVFAELDPALRSRLLEAFRREAVQPPYPEARGIVEDLARDFVLGLVSNTVIPGDHHARNLLEAGILQHFRVAVWSANFGRRKPDPAMIEHVLARLGARAEEALLVGDKRRTDVRAARRAGVRVAWLRRGRESETENVPDAEFTIDDLRALPALVRQEAGIRSRGS
ncbi:MAG: HAD family hydrolase [Myxococcota bacterium]